MREGGTEGIKDKTGGKDVGDDILLPVHGDRYIRARLHYGGDMPWTQLLPHRCLDPTPQPIVKSGRALVLHFDK